MASFPNCVELSDETHLPSQLLMRDFAVQQKTDFVIWSKVGASQFRAWPVELSDETLLPSQQLKRRAARCFYCFCAAKSGREEVERRRRSEVSKPKEAPSNPTIFCSCCSVAGGWVIFGQKKYAQKERQTSFIS